MKEFFPRMAHHIMTEPELKRHGHSKPHDPDRPSLPGTPRFPSFLDGPHVQAQEANESDGRDPVSGEVSKERFVSELPQSAVGNCEHNEGKPGGKVPSDHRRIAENCELLRVVPEGNKRTSFPVATNVLPEKGRQNAEILKTWFSEVQKAGSVSYF